MPGVTNDMGFYGVVVPAKSTRRVDLVGNEEEDGSSRVYLHISNVALGADPASGPHNLQISTSDGDFVLATLDKAHSYQHRLEIVIDEGITLVNSGPSPLHVTGYQTVVYPQDHDSDDEDYEDDMDEDEDEDDEDGPAPRAVPLSSQKAAGRRGALVVQEGEGEDDEDEEGEDDEDEDDEDEDEDGEDVDDAIRKELLGKRLAYFAGPPGQGRGGDDDDSDEGEDDEDEGTDEDEEGEDGDLDLEEIEFGSDDFVGEAVEDEGEDDEDEEGEDDEDEDGEDEAAEPTPPRKADGKKRIAPTPAATPAAAPAAKKVKGQVPPASAPAKAHGKEAKAAAKASGTPAVAAKANGTPVAAATQPAAAPPATAPAKSKDAGKAGKAAEAPKSGQKGGPMKEPGDEKAYEKELVAFIRESGGAAKLTAVGQAIRKPPQVTKLTAYLNSKPAVFKYDAASQEVKLAQ